MNIVDSPATTAAVIALAMGLVRIIENLVSWITKKVSPQQQPTVYVELSPETNSTLRETYNHVARIDDAVSEKDGDGVPLIYGDRHTLRDVDEKLDKLLGLAATAKKNGV